MLQKPSKLPDHVTSAEYDDEAGEITVKIKMTRDNIVNAKTSSTGKSRLPMTLQGGIRFPCRWLSLAEGGQKKVGQLVMIGSIYFKNECEILTASATTKKSKSTK